MMLLSYMGTIISVVTMLYGKGVSTVIIFTVL